MARTVDFTVGQTTYNSAASYSLIYIGKTTEIPEPRITTVEIPGRNGLLDLTDALTGSAQFKDFKVTLNFIFDTRIESNIKTKLTNLCSNINGKTVTATLPDTFVYTGRATVKDFHNDNLLWFVSVELHCLNPANGGGFN